MKRALALLVFVVLAPACAESLIDVAMGLFSDSPAGLVAEVRQ